MEFIKVKTCSSKNIDSKTHTGRKYLQNIHLISEYIKPHNLLIRIQIIQHKQIGKTLDIYQLRYINDKERSFISTSLLIKEMHIKTI